jgi:hypothetical protein
MQGPKAMDPSMMDTRSHNPMTNWIAMQDNNKRIRDIGVIANYRYLHRNMKNRLEQQIVVPLDMINLHLVLEQIAYSNLGKESPSVLTAEEV